MGFADYGHGFNDGFGFGGDKMRGNVCHRFLGFLDR
jgi:hypothetical protein